MNDVVLLSFALLGTAVLFVAGIVLLGVGALAWTKAIHGAHESRFAELQADVAVGANEALDIATDPNRRNGRAKFVPPTEAEIKEMLLLERAASGDLTTDNIESGEEVESPFPGTGLYADTRHLDG